MNNKFSKIIFALIVIICSKTFSQEKPNEDVKGLMSTYYNDNFKPFQKGNWFVAFSMSLNNQNFENTDYRLEKILEGEKSSYELNFVSGYYFSSYFAASLGFLIGNESFDRKIPKIIGSIDKSSSTDILGISPALRSSIPIVPNQRLNLYVDLGFDFNWGETTSIEKDDNEIISSYTSNNYGFGVGIKPGITFFVIENFALEIGLEILGYNYESIKTTFEDNTPNEKYTSHSVDFDLSLSTLQLSLSYYIGANKVTSN